MIAKEEIEPQDTYCAYKLFPFWQLDSAIVSDRDGLVDAIVFLHIVVLWPKVYHHVPLSSRYWLWLLLSINTGSFNQVQNTSPSPPQIRTSHEGLSLVDWCVETTDVSAEGTVLFPTVKCVGSDHDHCRERMGAKLQNEIKELSESLCLWQNKRFTQNICLFCLQSEIRWRRRRDLCRR